MTLRFAEIRGRRTRPAICVVVAVVCFVGCRSTLFGPDERAGGSQPLAYHERGASAYVEAIETNGDLITAELTIVNGTGEDIKICDRADPIALQDNRGRQYVSADDEVKLPAFSTSSLSVNFAGPLESGAEKLTLRINPKYGNNHNSPQLTVAEVSVNAGGRMTFAAQTQSGGALPAEASVNHANGTTLALREINFGESEIALDFEAVNGHKNDITFAKQNSDRPFLQDDGGRRYYLVPPLNNAELKIPAGQKMSGLLRFAGRLAPQASRLTLHINDRFGGDRDYSNDPKIVIPNILIKR